MEVDYIIVGQGLMGSLLAAALQRRQQRVYVFDCRAPWAASPQAAGIYHPLSSRNHKPVWQAEVLFPKLRAHYQVLETRWGARFLYPMGVYRPFLHAREAASAKQQQATDRYIEARRSSSLGERMIKDPFGGMLLRDSGRIDMAAFLSAARRAFEQAGAYATARVEAAQCTLPSTGGVNYAGLQAKAILFCEGIGVAQNPFFRGLPLRPLAGEWLQGALPAVLPYIVNRQGYVVPSAGGRVHIGSSYTHVKDGRMVQPTAAGKRTLLQIYHRLCRAPLRYHAHGAAARPATADRRPWVGLHPKYPAIGVCNGLGTRGVALAPYVADSMAARLVENQQIHTEMQLLRQQGMHGGSALF